MLKKNVFVLTALISAWYPVSVFGDFCPSGVKCLKKCCPEGQSLDLSQTPNCTISSSSNLFLESVENVSTFNIIHGITCEKEQQFRVPLNPVIEGFQFQLKSDGFLEWNNLRFNHINSCVDVFSEKLVAVVCATDEDADAVVTSVGMIISMPFLLATFIAYALLPDRNLHMKALMFYVITLMLSYLFLVIIQLSPGQFSDVSCNLLGYLCLFCFILSFFWMNVICIDIWFAFSGFRGFSRNGGGTRKRFLMYCAYAWGISILHILVVFGIQQLSHQAAWYNPRIGNGQCFLHRGYPELLYLYGPMAVLITINITLFAITALKIISIKRDTSMLKREDSRRHTYENDKQDFKLYLKLLFAMGVNWSMEVISWAVNWAFNESVPGVWYVTDFCNAIYGVFIFFMFVFKRSIWKLLKKRYYSFTGRPHMAHSMTQNPTRVTSCSTTVSSVHDNHHGESTTLTSGA